MSTILLTVNGVDKTSAIDWKTLKKGEVLTREPDSLNFRTKNSTTKTYRPTLNDEVVLTNDSVKVFGGIVVESQEVIDGALKYFSVSCKDYTQLLDRYLVSKVYTNQTAEDIIDDIISTFTTGFTTTNVVANVVVPKIIFNYLTVSQCLQKLVETIGNVDWYVDYDKDIHFFFNANIATYATLTDTSQNFVFQSLEVRDETHQIRNEIIIRGGEIESVSTRTETFDGDGTKVLFKLGSKFSSLPTVTVSAVSKTVGIDFLDDDTSYQCMWNFNEKYIRFTAGNTPAAGTNNISITGTPLYPLILRKQNNTSIALYGVYQYLIVDKTIKDIDTASQRADAEILKYALPLRRAKFTTYTDGFKVGQNITINSTIRNINQSYKIESINARLRTPTDLVYDVNLINSDDIGINDILTKLLIRNISDQIEIGSDEVVQRYQGFSESIAITDTVGAPTKTSPPYVWGTALWGRSTWS
jgi:hypothetical protein